MNELSHLCHPRNPRLILQILSRDHQPSLSWVTSRLANSSVAKGSACRSSVVTSVPTKKLVVPTTSPEGPSDLPSGPTSLYFNRMARLNSLVANTFPRTERAGDLLMRMISPLRVASAESPPTIRKVPSC